jgi:hypothetical protein
MDQHRDVRTQRRRGDASRRRQSDRRAEFAADQHVSHDYAYRQRDAEFAWTGQRVGVVRPDAVVDAYAQREFVVFDEWSRAVYGADCARVELGFGLAHRVS